MALENKVSFKLEPEKQSAAKTAVDTLVSTLQPGLISLTDGQRKNIPKMGDGSVPFVQKTLEYVGTNPEFAPKYLDVSELKIDIDAFNLLTTLERPIMQLLTSIDDTKTLSGSEAYITALAYYNAVKFAAKQNIPGAKTIYEDLSKRFEGQKGPKGGGQNPPQV